MSEPTQDERWDELTPRQRTFALAYLVDGNGARAAIEAGYSENGAKVQAHRLLTDVNLRSWIDAERQRIWTAAHMGAEETMAELAGIARFNIADVVTVTRDGDPYFDLSKADRVTMAAISQVEIKDVVEGRGDDIRTVRSVKVKQHSKMDALKTIAGHHGLTKDRVVHEVDEGLAEMLMKGRRRAATGEATND